MRSKALGAACVLASLALLPGCGDADPFCKDLKTVTDAASDNFSSIKGAADPIFPDSFMSTVKLSGANDCSLDAFGGDNVFSYTCFWPLKDDAWIASTYAQLAPQVDGCLSGGEKTIEADHALWRKPGAWKVTLDRRSINGKARGKLRLIVDKG